LVRTFIIVKENGKSGIVTGTNGEGILCPLDFTCVVRAERFIAKTKLEPYSPEIVVLKEEDIYYGRDVVTMGPVKVLYQP
jgi:hypothetical protein